MKKLLSRMALVAGLTAGPVGLAAIDAPQAQASTVICGGLHQLAHHPNLSLPVNYVNSQYPQMGYTYNCDPLVYQNTPGFSWSFPVSSIQAVLNYALGTHLVVDGHYGPATRSAVITFQRRLGVTADGVWGPVTNSHAGWYFVTH